MNLQNKVVQPCRHALLRIVADRSGQDMIEYALLTAAVAVIAAAAIPTSVVPIMSRLYSGITAALNAS
jgi:Flp pilus assembly pilin Flp